MASRLLEYKHSQEELEKNQKYFKTILDSVNDAIIIFDINGKVIDANETAIRTYAYSKEEILNMTRLQFVSKNYPNSPNVGDSAEKIVNGMKKYNSFIIEDVSVDKHGKETWVEINHHITTIDGEDRVVAAVRDDSYKDEKQVQHNNSRIDSFVERINIEFSDIYK